MISFAVSSLADAALLLPAAALVLLYLAVLRQGRLILAFAASLGVTAATILVLKLVFHACGHAVGDASVVSPSGHVSFGTAFWSALAMMFAAGHPRALRIVAALGVLLLLVGVGISRVRLGAHTTPEVLIGYVVGAGGAGLFAALHAWSGRPRLPWLPVALGLAAAIVLLGGNHFSLEPRIARYARMVADGLDVCEPAQTLPERWRGRFPSGRS